jgi:hypothetical protein
MIIEFPKAKGSLRQVARHFKPRRSKNGTPEERAAKAAAKAAAPTTVVATAYKRNSDTHAALRRAAQIVRVLGEYGGDGWTFDKARGTRFLESMCNLDYKDGDCDEMTTILEWVSDHGQSLDWIFRGDPVSMICAGAALAPSRAKYSKPKLVTPDPPAPGAA